MLTVLLMRLYFKKKDMSKAKQKQIADCMRELMTADRSNLLEQLAMATNGFIQNDAIMSGNTCIYPYFFGKLSIEKLNIAYNLAIKNNKKLLVLCSETTVEIEKNIELFSETPISILSKDQAYSFLSKYGLLPEIKIRSKKRTHLLKAALRKSKIKGYLFTAIILLFTAAFSPYAILCIVAAAFNITMSILCEIKGN